MNVQSHLIIEDANIPNVNYDSISNLAVTIDPTTGIEKNNFFDCIFKINDFKTKINESILVPTLDRFFNGYNTSLIIVSSKAFNLDDLLFNDTYLPQGLLNYSFSKAIDSRSTGFKKFTANSFEIYGDAIRDLFNPDKILTLKNAKITGLSNIGLKSTFDLAMFVEKVKGNLEGCDSDQRKSNIFHSLTMDQMEDKDGVFLMLMQESLSTRQTLSLVVMNAVDFAAMDKTKLILSKIQLIRPGTKCCLFNHRAI